MQYRTLGRTGIRVSEISYGAWGIGGGLWHGNDDKESLLALHRAADLGLNFIDTALAYGDGHSEQIVREFLRGRKERITVATKIPPATIAKGRLAGLRCGLRSYQGSNSTSKVRNKGIPTVPTGSSRPGKAFRA